MCFSFPEWASKLANTYWLLRYNRKFNLAARRKYYRHIANEKKRLHESSRLACLILINILLRFNIIYIMRSMKLMCNVFQKWELLWKPRYYTGSRCTRL